MTDQTQFAGALVATRKAAGMRQSDLARHLGLSARTMSRWEMGLAMPREFVREALVAWLQAQATPDAERALTALGVLLPRAPAANAEKGLTPEGAREAKLAIDHALYTAAEAHVVPARAARLLVVAVLEAIEAKGLTVGVARGLVAPAS